MALPAEDASQKGWEMTNLQVSAQREIKQFVEQIERLSEEQKALGGDIRDKYLEAKSRGYDPKIIRKVVQARKKSKADFAEEQAVLDAYLHAVDWISTPLGARSESEAPQLATV
jgi:uncharacterized protein (UPF0335 family)